MKERWLDRTEREGKKRNEGEGLCSALVLCLLFRLLDSPLFFCVLVDVVDVVAVVAAVALFRRFRRIFST